MKATSLILTIFFSIVSLASFASAKQVPRQPVHFESSPRPDAPLPYGLATQYGGPLRSAAAADTFVLHFADFNDASGQPDVMGYTSIDLTDQIKAFFHVADGTELDGGSFGNLLPLSGAQSMWCGQDESTDPAFCGYASLPGYGNTWDQILESNALVGDSVSISYKVFWDSEGGYDWTVVEYTFDDGATWFPLPVTDTLSTTPGVYDNIGVTPFITESFATGSSGATNVRIRFRFTSDGAWSDEDGLWQTDGAILVDDVAVSTWAGGAAAVSDTEDFESAAPGANVAGIWTGKKGPSFGHFAALYPGISLLQEDPCFTVFDFVWGFFDDPLNTNYSCHTPDPRPEVGAVPFGNLEGLYINNQIWSPIIPNIGTGDEYRLSFLVYRDLPLDNLVFYRWDIRSLTDGCPSNWRDFSFVYFGSGRDWLRNTFQVGSLVTAGADSLQIAVGVIDLCPVWCPVFGPLSCHSHAPLIDEIRLERVAVSGPQYVVRQIELFQDNFAEDGTLTGTARFDAAIDILPSRSPGILPGDSCAITVAPAAGDPNTGTGPAVYMYVAEDTRPTSGGGVYTAAQMESNHVRNGTRYPYVGSQMHAGVNWHVFRFDTAVTAAGGILQDRFCVDLNDNLFVPGDTIRYFFGADADGTPSNGNESYWHRTLDGQGRGTVTPDVSEAAASACETTILPAGGFNRGGDILYVDDTDDRGGPAELLFDSAFDIIGLRDLIDRYDVLGPSSAVANSPASRVKDNVGQIIDIYRVILWNTGNLSSATVGDGTGNPEKSDDWGLLYQFLDTSDLGPGLYLSGDDLAEEWVRLSGTGAIDTRSAYMNFNLLDRDHIRHGEAVSPSMTATGPAFVHALVPDRLVAYGGCPLINDFDVLQPTGSAIIEFPYPASGDGAVISQQTLNAAGQTATVVLSGFSYHSIRDAVANFPPARAEHIRDILIKMGTAPPEATGVDPGVGPRFVNALFNNYPNPFNPQTTIKYTIKARGQVSLKVYNAAGQLVRTLVDEVQAPDRVRRVTWDGRNSAGRTVTSGVYFYRLVTEDFSLAKKMVLLK